MKGLLIKDLQEITRETKIYLLFILAAACFQNTFMISFAVVYASMLPMTALAFDERSKWELLAAMMPYSTRELVMSKYFLGYITVVLTVFVSVVARLAWGLFGQTGVTADFLGMMLTLVCVGLILLSIILPLLYRLGVEKARILLIIIVMAFAFLSADFLTGNVPKNILNGSTLAVTIIAAIIINVISVMISIKVYKTERFK